MTSLKELTKLLSSKPDMETLSMSEVNVYLNDLEHTGTEIMRRLESMEAVTLVNLLMSRAVSVMLSEGELSARQLDFMLSKQGLIYAAGLIKLAIAIGAIEELW